jgi:hypothetical protein
VGADNKEAPCAVLYHPVLTGDAAGVACFKQSVQTMNFLESLLKPLGFVKKYEPIIDEDGVPFWDWKRARPKIGITQPKETTNENQ